MKLKTILNAMTKAKDNAEWMEGDYKKYIRQYRAFRARILRMDAENIEQLAQAEIQERNLNKQIAELEKENTPPLDWYDKE